MAVNRKGRQENCNGFEVKALTESFAISAGLAVNKK